jgi:hypothetical protein
LQSAKEHGMAQTVLIQGHPANADKSLSLTLADIRAVKHFEICRKAVRLTHVFQSHAF